MAIRNDALYETRKGRGLALSVGAASRWLSSFLKEKRSYAVGVLLRPSKLRGACRRQASRWLSSSLKEKRRLYAALTQFNNLDAARL
ncbi:MAG: hypothetical protein V7L29_33000 [Nostoc sp.]|uniref:hypothetical protein n=1 Tax=Nostoc sp. TaxID=1180 RepID=UPI002FFB1085